MSFLYSQSRALRTACRTTVAAVILFGAGSIAVAAEPGQARTYAGDLLSRSTMTGNWDGVRDEWARNGMTINADVTQTYQGVVDGGKSSHWQYGGRGDFTLDVDTAKAGLWSGGFLTVELEGNWGKAVNLNTGALMTVNSNQAFPVVGETVFAVPAVSLRQSLSEDFSLVVGKLDTIATGDLNAFAHGKGDDQFLNLAFNINPVLIMTVPYSTLGVGVVYMPAADPGAVVASLSVVSAVGEANTSGFSELSANALTVTGEARWRTDFFGQTGHQLLGFTYCNNEFTSLDQRLGAFLPTAQIQKKTGSWSAFWNFDQYLYESQKRSGQGVGIFGRLGVADGNPNPARFFASLGLGGKGLAGRPYDDFGIAWYYLDVASPTFTTDIGTRQVLGNEHGLEGYYTLALTRWALLTADLQVVNPSQNATHDGKPINTDTVLGIRLKLMF
jgi:porin